MEHQVLLTCSWKKKKKTRTKMIFATPQHGQEKVKDKTSIAHLKSTVMLDWVL